MHKKSITIHIWKDIDKGSDDKGLAESLTSNVNS